MGKGAQELSLNIISLNRDKSLWTVLGDYEAATAEASHNFNFSAVDFDNDSELVLVIDLGVTLALILQLRINADTSANYFTDGRIINGGVETLVDLGGIAAYQILSTTSLGAVNASGFAEVHIGLPKAGTQDRPLFYSFGGSGSGPVNESYAGSLNKTVSSITDVEVRTSTSTWQIGTRMTLYKVARS